MFFTAKEMSKDKFKSNNAMCHFEIDKADVESKNFDKTDNFIKKIASYGRIARQKVLFSFAGYDDDERELIYIPEVVKYTKELLRRHHCFWYYATPFNSEFFILAALIKEQNSVIVNIPLVRKFHVKQDPEELKHFLNEMAIKLNIYGEQIDDINGAVESLKAWSFIITGSIK